ncbi:hypothetical protein [Marinobacterium lutimaris]|uniref:Uncharacterized protein n=1 Tax=Marinobacterium lutimaris TaxID=568106 RepID=A0A1H5XNI4_9GAMM|nr:hypothetical protein [Marinobacterium lutimaris]SEG12977.1 hypothetical protein SAMN05444390_1011439 [Marinobacterium lutimaris]
MTLGVLTEEDRRVEIGLVLELAQRNATELLQDHLKVCVTTMGLPRQHLEQIGRNLMAAHGPDFSEMGKRILNALEGLRDA